MNRKTVPLSLLMAVMMLIMMPSFCMAEHTAYTRLSYDPQDPEEAEDEFEEALERLRNCIDSRRKA